MPQVLITGASRGLGLEFSRQYASDGWQVLATCRNPDKSKKLLSLADKLENISIYRMDISDNDSVDTCALKLQDKNIDVLINNAGIASNDFNTQKLGGFDFKFWERVFRVNTLGAFKVTQAFLRNINSSTQKKIAIVSSKVGSLSDMNSYPVYPYATSKAALNKGVRLMSEQLKKDGISVICLCPGHARTDMGLMAEGASIEVDDAVSGMRDMIDKLNIHNSGSFKQFDGQNLSW